MQDKKTHTHQPMQNIQMMMVEPREEDHSANIVTRSGMAIGEDKAKGWVHKNTKEKVDFHLKKAQETFMEAKKSFIEASTSGS